ncbi:MAG: hypothetical protein OXL37_01785 [Chloroflexota bacterium]|nr:hypothetical protein [Chloroflexota bacterium]
MLVCDGPSDAGLGNHIQSLLVGAGALQVNWTASYVGRRLTEKIALGLDQSSYPNMLFVHRDAEGADPNDRYIEIRSAVNASGYTGPLTPIVPRRTIEAWLLLDGPAIREIVGRPRGTEPLALPQPRDIERDVNPKERLRQALLVASAPRGRRRVKRFNANWENYRNQLLENLPIGGPLERLESWTRFRDDTIAALNLLSN